MVRILNSFIYAVFALCVIVCAQEQGLSVKFEDASTRYVSVGATDLSFKCIINRGVMFVIKHTVEIVRVRLSGEENILTRSGKIIDADPAYYNVAVTPVKNDIDLIHISFKINEVRDIDDATLLCRVTMENPDSVIEAKVDVVVLRPLTSLSIQFANYPALFESTDAPLAVDAGRYSVSCIAEGSNPPAEDIYLTQAGEMVNHSAPIDEVIDGDVRTFRVNITGQVDLTMANSGDVFECSARSKLEDTLSTKFPIKINVYEPEIMCNDSVAYEGKMHPTIECTVDHEGLDITGFGYQLDLKGGPHYEMIMAGDKNDDHVTVKEERISASETRVILDLYKAEGWHFDSDFYLIVKQANGHMSRKKVYLHQTDVPSDGSAESLSSMKKASLVLLLLSVVCAWLWF